MSENRRIQSNQRSKHLERRKRYARRGRYEEAYHKAQSGQDNLRQAEGSGVIISNDQYVLDMSENEVYADE